MPDVIVIYLTILVLIMLLIESKQALTTKVLRSFVIIDIAVCFVFLAEFFYRLKQAENRRRYFVYLPQ